MIRPQNFVEYIGQPHVKMAMQLAMAAAKANNTAVDHALFTGPPGLGKTSLAYIVAREMGTKLHQTAGPTIERAGDLTLMLSHVNRGDVFFIDEIHRLPKLAQEALYTAMEDNRMDVVLGHGATAMSLSVHIHPFTLIGATTDPSLLTGPLRDRFGLFMSLDFYTEPDLATIADRYAIKIGYTLDAGVSSLIASRSRGTPRVANKLVRRAVDLASVYGTKIISKAIAKQTFDIIEVDEAGLERHHRKILSIIARDFGGGPVGLDSIAAMTGEDRAAIKDVYEPYLVRRGLIMRTPRGRVLTEKGGLLV